MSLWGAVQGSDEAVLGVVLRVTEDRMGALGGELGNTLGRKLGYDREKDLRMPRVWDKGERRVGGKGSKRELRDAKDM